MESHHISGSQGLWCQHIHFICVYTIPPVRRNGWLVEKIHTVGQHLFRVLHVIQTYTRKTWAAHHCYSFTHIYTLSLSFYLSLAFFLSLRLSPLPTFSLIQQRPHPYRTLECGWMRGPCYDRCCRIAPHLAKHTPQWHRQPGLHQSQHALQQHRAPGGYTYIRNKHWDHERYRCLILQRFCIAVTKLIDTQFLGRNPSLWIFYWLFDTPSYSSNVWVGFWHLTGWRHVSFPRREREWVSVYILCVYICVCVVLCVCERER